MSLQRIDSDDFLMSPWHWNPGRARVWALLFRERGATLEQSVFVWIADAGVVIEPCKRPRGMSLQYTLLMYNDDDNLENDWTAEQAVEKCPHVIRVDDAVAVELRPPTRTRPNLHQARFRMPHGKKKILLVQNNVAADFHHVLAGAYGSRYRA